MPTELDKFELTWYMQEICMHGLGARIEYSHLVSTLENPDTRQTRIVWFHLTSFLSHAAMISKYLSPIKNNEVALARKNVLREILGIAADSEVLPRDTRDNVEHFDERIDNWVGSENQNILEIVLPDRAGYHFMRVDEKRVKRVLILDEFVFVSEKRDATKFELPLHPLHQEVSRIELEAEKWIRKKSPYHFIFPR
ncbi:hypothetical protein [Hydrogenophaga soli]